MKELLIIGNGVAGATAAENIRKMNQQDKITIITEEPLPFYYRIRLNEFLAGDITEKQLIAKSESWYKEHHIELLLKNRVNEADGKEKTVMTEAGERISWDSLLIATGSHSFIPPIKGADKGGVFALRNIRDARDIYSYAEHIEEVVLIGGGLLGLEAGNALRKLGKKVKVVEFFPRLLPRQLDLEGAKRLQKMMENMGFSFRLGAKTEEIVGKDGVDGVVLEGGESLSGEMVVVSAGVRPNLELAEALGLGYDKGIKVDGTMRTSQPDIYAAGDVAEFNDMVYGIWPAAMEQGKVAGVNMAGGDEVYEGTTMANTLKVVGIDLASAGDIDAENKLESRVVTKEELYKKIVIDEEQRIVGCIMLGDTKGFNNVTRAMSKKTDVSEVKDEILEEGFDFKRLH